MPIINLGIKQQFGILLSLVATADSLIGCRESARHVLRVEDKKKFNKLFSLFCSSFLTITLLVGFPLGLFFYFLCLSTYGQVDFSNFTLWACVVLYLVPMLTHNVGSSFKTLSNFYLQSKRLGSVLKLKPHCRAEFITSLTLEEITTMLTKELGAKVVAGNGAQVVRLKSPRFVCSGGPLLPYHTNIFPLKVNVSKDKNVYKVDCLAASRFHLDNLAKPLEFVLDLIELVKKNDLEMEMVECLLY